MGERIRLGYETIQYGPHLLADPPGLPRQIKAAARAGFDWISFDRHSLDHWSASGRPLIELANLCHRFELRCREVHSLRITADENETVAAATRTAGIIGSLHPAVMPVIMFVPATEAAIARLVRAAELVLAVAPELRLALEFSPLFPVASIQDGLDVMNRAAIAQLGLLVDSWHFFQGGQDWSALAALTGDQIELVQLNDHGTLQPPDLHKEKNLRMIPGQGCFPLDRFLRTLDAIGYCGPISVEVINNDMRSMPVEEFAQKAYASTMELWSRR